MAAQGLEDEDSQQAIIPPTDANGKSLPNLRFYNSTIQGSFSIQNTLQILQSTIIISDCRLVDNYAKFVTHGITLISSTLYVEKTLISFTPAFK